MKPIEALLRNSNRALLRIRSNSTMRAQTAPTAVRIHSTPRAIPSSHRAFSSNTKYFKGLQPDTSDPKPPNPEPSGASAGTDVQPAPISESEYHELSEQYIDNLQKALEERAEDASNGIELEYAAGVLNITTPQGVYVINKQPPNKQLWLSSPISGPKRYDWVVTGAGQNTKEGTETDIGDDGAPGGGKWVYLRDGSKLSDLLKDEISVEVGSELETSEKGSSDAGV